MHGCYDELTELLALLGYQPDAEAGMRHPEGRRAVFVGDLVDRGPKVVETVDLVRRMVAAGQAFCVPGNHDDQAAALPQGPQGADQLRPGREHRADRGAAAEERARLDAALSRFADALISHFVLDGGDLVVAHAGMKEEYQGRASRRVRDFALYGETTGETDEFGLPIRANWAADYRGSATVVYGHTPVPEPIWLNNTINIDTGCVFGGKLTALRWPERELVSVAAHRVYAEPERPLARRGQRDAAAERHRYAAAHRGRAGQAAHRDAAGGQRDRRGGSRRRRARGDEPLRARSALADLSAADDVAERDIASAGLAGIPRRGALPTTARQGVARVVCEEKHMGSRAVVVLCRDGAGGRAPLRRAEDARARRMLHAHRAALLRRRCARPRACSTRLARRARRALVSGSVSRRIGSAWTPRLLPWSAKAQGLLREQYAPVAAAGTAALAATLAVGRGGAGADSRCGDGELLERLRGRAGEDRTLRRGLSRLLLGDGWAGGHACRAIPPAGHRGHTPTSTATTSGTWRTGAAGGGRSALPGDDAPRGRSLDDAARAPRRRLVARVDGARRRRAWW